MPVERNNNLINNPSIIIPVRIRREQTETQNNNVTFPDLNEYQPVTPGLFNSYGINQPLQLKIERVNDSESDMHEVFELDKLVFAEQDPYEDYEEFKSFINNNQLSTYVVRDENDNNKILGYYQLEPVKNGDLYIDSIGLKPEYRNSRKGYQAIKASWANILNYARENGANTLSLHVTADNRNLLRMYESFGFTIKETLNNYYGNGSDAYFMEKILEPAPVEEPEVQTGDAALQTDTPAVISDTEEGQNIETTQQNEISPAENVEQQPEAAPEEELYSRKFEQAKSELIAMGIPDDYSDLLDYLSECTRMKNGHQVFSDELFESVKYLIQVGKDYPDAFTFGQMTTTQLRKIFNSLTENDENGSIRTMRTDLLPYVRVFAQNGISAGYYDNIFNAAKETQPDGSKDISRKALDKVCRFKPYISDYYLPKIIQNCLLRDKDGRTYFSEEALAAAEHSLVFNRGELFDSDILSLLQFSKQIDNDGNQVFNKKLYNDLLKQVTDNNIPYDKKLFYGTSQIEEAYNIGCDMEALLKYGSIVIRNREIDKIIANVDYKNRDSVGLKLFKACTYEYPKSMDNFYDFSQQKSRVNFDRSVLAKFIELQSANPPVFQDVQTVPEILDACKEQRNRFESYKFNPELVNKAIQLKNAGISEKDISKIMESCKTAEKDIRSGKVNSIKFNDEIFNTVIKTLQDRSLYSNEYLADYIKCSKDMSWGKEVFKPEKFDRLKKSYMITTDGNRPTSEDFFNVWDENNRFFDIDLYEKFLSTGGDLDSLCNIQIKNNRRINIPDEEIMDAYIKLRDMNIKYTPWEGEINSNNPAIAIIEACYKKGRNYPERTFDPFAFKSACELLDKGYDGREVLQILYNCQHYESNKGKEFYPPRYELVKKLIAQGIDIRNAGAIAEECIEENNCDTQKLDKCMELYNMGIKEPVCAIRYTKDDDLAYNRLKQAFAKNVSINVIEKCKLNNEFQDRLFRLAMDLHDKGYSSNTIIRLMDVCRIKSYKAQKPEETFNYDMYNHIADLEKLGIQKDNIASVLDSCKGDGGFLADAYDKVSQLYYKKYDDAGIAEFLKRSQTNGNFDIDKYNLLLKLTAKHEVLKGITHDDTYVIKKIAASASDINKAAELFGEDVINNMITAKIDNYITFVKQCNTLNSNYSETFIKDLQEKLNTLPSPELKVKRLRILGALANKVDENALRQLVKLIKSPEMTPEQIQLANSIFADKETDYKTRVEKFITAIQAPDNAKDIIREYLLKARLDKQIDYPKTLKEQMAQMDVFAQQMLTNPKTPLEKKLKYIDEFKAKKADMRAHPKKYTTPEIFPKPLYNLKQFVQAYINIPKADSEFNNSITLTMYNKFGIEPNDQLLNKICYDAKYFDKLFSGSGEFADNFKRLIELQKMNPDKPLSQNRLELPETGSSKYATYEDLGLIKQIEANQDTVRQFKEHNLNFDKWNTFDENLKSEEFTVEADPETEYKNTLFNLINIFQDEYFNKINPEETEKLMQNLDAKGYTLFNNKLYHNGEIIKNTDIEYFAQAALDYITNDKYWTSAAAADSELSEDERNGINAFKDHLKDNIHHLKEIRGAKTVSNIYFRLSNDDDIGRNIFFGNHVGCCNSVDSTYAGYSAPMHLLNNFNRGIELVDRYGNSYGNSMCFFADVDGKLAFIIDSFEANGKLGSNPLVTDELIKFAHKVCREMGREDAVVLIGPRFNHIDMSRLQDTMVDSFKILGTVSEKTYCDCAGGTECKDNINNGCMNVNMKKYV